MTPEQEERFVAALEDLAAAVWGLATTNERTYLKKYPEPVVPRPALVTHIQTEEERIREAQGASDEPIDRWTSLGSESSAEQKK